MSRRHPNDIVGCPRHVLQAVLHPQVLLAELGAFASRRRRRRRAPTTTAAAATAIGRNQPVAQAPSPEMPSQARTGAASGMVAQKAAQATARTPAVPAAVVAPEGLGLESFNIVDFLLRVVHID
jgi:hypothetical protein